ncbi:hypothetical protein LTR62_008427 [Meristemomyces frigidus]|uniref:Uncharacterized protein n=1 Tax=Meristemomyces frigidus TaxID=1508187 RepID=A0AAN7T9N4_9PEZI|nr:hypothetical protein LTR62_008427 [Meristemomyces frigidus]
MSSSRASVDINIIETISQQVRSFSTMDLTLRKRATAKASPRQAFREDQLSDSVARRLFKRSAHTWKPPHEDAMFAAHRANIPSHTHTETSLSPNGTVPAVSNKPAWDSFKNELRHDKETRVGKAALLRSLNSARHIERVPHVVLDDDICATLRQYANSIDDLKTSTNNSALQYTMIMPFHHPLSNDHTKSLRLVSPPGLGGLACGELWSGGKYKRHMISLYHTDPEHLRTCACHLHVVWQCLVEPRYTRFGAARSRDGKWIVQLEEEIKTKLGSAALSFPGAAQVSGPPRRTEGVARRNSIAKLDGIKDDSGADGTMGNEAAESGYATLPLSQASSWETTVLKSVESCQFASPSLRSRASSWATTIQPTHAPSITVGLRKRTLDSGIETPLNHGAHKSATSGLPLMRTASWETCSSTQEPHYLRLSPLPRSESQASWITADTRSTTSTVRPVGISAPLRQEHASGSFAGGIPRIPTPDFMRCAGVFDLGLGREDTWQTMSSIASEIEERRDHGDEG